MALSIISQHVQTEAFECDSCGEIFQPHQIGRDLSAADSLTPIILCEECADGDDSTFNMDDLAAALEARGIPAFVAMTGGGVATLYGGEIVGTDEWDGNRYVVAVGPGTYGWSVGPSEGYWGELFIGPDDLDETDAGGYWRGICDVNVVADYIVTRMDDYRATVAAFVSERVDA